uniref:Uncharacterized protein n=1 Tax=Panagrolaimus sp. ES5 TaxID=591445 RepID=A0AC34GNR7_9BILA
MHELKVKEPPYHIFFLFLGCVACLFLIQPYLFEEILSSIFHGNDSIIISSTIFPRNLSIDIGILIIVDEKINLNDYWQALASIECYAGIHGYGFKIVKINDYWRSQCNNKNIQFLRHCIASKLLKTHEWTLFLSPETGIVNPDRLIEEFIVDENADIIFYDRLLNWEISSDSFLARNSTFATQFLMKFAQLENELSTTFHWLFLQEFYLSTSFLQLSPSDCWSILSTSKSDDDYQVFKACCRQILGERHKFCIGSNCIHLIPKGKAWIRDVTITDSTWSLENDFMFYGWRESYRIPTVEENGAWTRASRRLLYSSWYSPLASMIFDQESCKNGTFLWKWHQSLLISNNELNEILDNVLEKSQSDFLKSLSSIPNFL